MSQEDKIRGCFKNNYYLTEEYVNFCAKVTGKGSIKIGPVRTIGRLNPSISIFAEKEKKFMRKNNIKFMSVTSKNNYDVKRPSAIEYSLYLKRAYKEAYEDYNRTFKKMLRRAERYHYKTRIKDNINDEELEEVYDIYREQMRRLGGFLFPKRYFKEFMELPSTILMMILQNNRTVGYSFCIRYKDNLYTSIGGSRKEFFDKHINYYTYDQKIRYACKNGLNIHMGIGMYKSGYNRFKQVAGAICLRCERFPDDEEKIRRLAPLAKNKAIGTLMILISKILPKKVVYLNMPFT